MVGCEHMVLRVVLMTIKDRFANYLFKTNCLTRFKIYELEI